jgi:nicotinamidase-related amidase
MKKLLVILTLTTLTTSGIVFAQDGRDTGSEAKKGGNLMKVALLLIDIQNDYFPGGRMELEGSAEAGSQAKKLLAFFREKKLPIIHIQHLSIRPGSTFFLPGTDGVKVNDSVAPLPNETVVQKNFPNSFRNTVLLDLLKKEGVTHVVIAGMMTHMCVDATTRAAFDNGFECWVVRDACATRSLKFGDKSIPADHVHGAFLAALGSVYARVVSVDEFISNNR